MLTYKVERFEQFVKEVIPLWQDHWEEIATHKDKIPLDPDFDRYQQLQDREQLICITVRDNGKLVGYSFMFVFPHIHYKSTIIGLNDLLYLKPEYRKGFSGVKLIKMSEEQCRLKGAKKVVWHIKTDHNFGKIMERLGYNLFEVNYGKYIGE